MPNMINIPFFDEKKVEWKERHTNVYVDYGAGNYTLKLDKTYSEIYVCSVTATNGNGYWPDCNVTSGAKEELVSYGDRGAFTFWLRSKAWRFTNASGTLTATTGAYGVQTFVVLVE